MRSATLSRYPLSGFQPSKARTHGRLHKYPRPGAWRGTQHHATFLPTLVPGSERGLGCSSAFVWAYIHEPPARTHTYRDLDPDVQNRGSSPANLPSRLIPKLQMNEFGFLRVNFCAQLMRACCGIWVALWACAWRFVSDVNWEHGK